MCAPLKWPNIILILVIIAVIAVIAGTIVYYAGMGIFEACQHR